MCVRSMLSALSGHRQSLEAAVADSKAEAVTRSGSTATLSAVRHSEALLQLEMKAAWDAASGSILKATMTHMTLELTLELPFYIDAI